MTIHHGPPNNKSLGDFCISINKTTATTSEVRTNKPEIPKGALVFVKTTTLYSSFLSWPGLAKPIITYNTPVASPSSTDCTWKWVEKPNYPWMTSPEYNGGYATSGLQPLQTPAPTTVAEPTRVLEEFKKLVGISPTATKITTEDFVKPGGSGTSGNKLGMVMMGNPFKKPKKAKAKKTKKSASTAGTPTQHAPGASTSTVMISSNTFKTSIPSSLSIYPDGPEYQVKGFATIENLMSGQAAIYVSQNEGYTKKELQEFFDKNAAYPEVGKPFNGIVVDRFIPQFSSEQGEVVHLQQPRLYKVLFNETNCLWLEEDVLTLMKPEDCSDEAADE